jgi:hypothetical protein
MFGEPDADTAVAVFQASAERRERRRTIHGTALSPDQLARHGHSPAGGVYEGTTYFTPAQHAPARPLSAPLLRSDSTSHDLALRWPPDVVLTPGSTARVHSYVYAKKAPGAPPRPVPRYFASSSSVVTVAEDDEDAPGAVTRWYRHPPPAQARPSAPIAITPGSMPVRSVPLRALSGRSTGSEDRWIADIPDPGGTASMKA